MDSNTRAKLQEEHKLLSERAQASRLEADQIRNALKDKQHDLNQAEEALTKARQELGQLQAQLQALQVQIGQTQGQIEMHQAQLHKVHQETANLAKNLGPVAQKQKRFEDALAMVEQNLSQLSNDSNSQQGPSVSPAQLPPLPPKQPPQIPPLSPPQVPSQLTQKAPPKVTQSAEQRSPRAQMGLSLSFEIGFRGKSEHNFYTGLTDNISEGGLFIATTQILDIGTVIKFPLSLPNMSTSENVEGVVRWVRHSDRSDDGVPGGVGVQFTKISDHLKNQINQYIRTIDTIFYDD